MRASSRWAPRCRWPMSTSPGTAWPLEPACSTRSPAESTGFVVGTVNCTASICGQFWLQGSDQQKLVGQLLSGGERNRVQLAKVLSNPEAMCCCSMSRPTTSMSIPCGPWKRHCWAFPRMALVNRHEPLVLDRTPPTSWPSKVTRGALVGGELQRLRGDRKKRLGRRGRPAPPLRYKPLFAGADAGRPARSRARRRASVPAPLLGLAGHDFAARLHLGTNYGGVDVRGSVHRSDKSPAFEDGGFVRKGIPQNVTTAPVGREGAGATGGCPYHGGRTHARRQHRCRGGAAVAGAAGAAGAAPPREPGQHSTRGAPRPASTWSSRWST